MLVDQAVDLETLNAFALRLHVASNTAIYKKIFSWKNFPATTRVWSKISYGDE